MREDGLHRMIALAVFVGPMWGWASGASRSSASTAWGWPSSGRRRRSPPASFRGTARWPPSTLAGTLTIVGSVANLIVVEQARSQGIDIGFVEYAKVGVPLTLLTLLLGWLILVFVPV